MRTSGKVSFQGKFLHGDPYQWLTIWIDARAMKRVAGHYVNVTGKMLLERGDFRCLARRLTTDDGAEFCCCVKFQSMIEPDVPPGTSYKVQTSSQQHRCSSPPHCR